MVENHYKGKKIVAIDKDDFRIFITGKIVEHGDNYIVVEDDTGKIKINHNLSDLKNIKTVRVFCTKIDNELFCDFIQNLEGLDLELYNKVEDLYLKFL
ncbi:MAG: hypothetical protein RMJ18_00375 [Candidatus Aenigmarchaeota archaeon]|nr:hypothetical protein [Candidatus Aenigmarchaeota archaeon]MCX8190868.1 hypothetical protein [Candidatus Aenigmarchaeota archaeon]MDW8159870.1 hypothetical protein [Candidatus Aenigmarchaeota archaeon]